MNELMDTNIVRVVSDTHETLVRLDYTLILIAAINALALILSGWNVKTSSVILKDVNSDRTKRIAEVEALNQNLTRVEKLNSILEERDRATKEVKGNALD